MVVWGCTQAVPLVGNFTFTGKKSLAHLKAHLHGSCSVTIHYEVIAHVSGTQSIVKVHVCTISALTACTN